MSARKTRPRILVIKLGALGDIIQTFDAFQAIRRHHADAQIALMTTPPYVAFARQMPWFDDVVVDTRSRTPAHYWRIRRLLRHGGWDRVYDLHTENRTARYWRLTWPPPRPVWSGHVPNCTFPRPPVTPDTHNRTRMAMQLEAAGVPDTGPADLDWLDAPIDRFALPERFALLVPGCSPTRPLKRWPPERFAAVAHWLAERGITPIAVGTRSDQPAIDAVRATAPEVVNLGGATSLAELAAIMRRAQAVIGNDTGPMFLAAALGAPSLMLMASTETHPVRATPRGPRADWIVAPTVGEITVEQVTDRIRFRGPA